MEETLKILLCEDDENLGMLLREYLQAKGFQAELCPDGEIGYKTFIKEKFDICVLDVMMPKKDGFTLAQEIRQANAEVPIIFLTAKQLKKTFSKVSRLVPTTTLPSLSLWKNWYSVSKLSFVVFGARRTRSSLSIISDVLSLIHRSNC